MITIIFVTAIIIVAAFIIIAFPLAGAELIPQRLVQYFYYSNYLMFIDLTVYF